jgi:hypothetical protein
MSCRDTLEACGGSTKAWEPGCDSWKTETVKLDHVIRQLDGNACATGCQCKIGGCLKGHLTCACHKAGLACASCCSCHGECGDKGDGLPMSEGKDRLPVRPTNGVTDGVSLFLLESRVLVHMDSLTVMHTCHETI